MFAAFVSPLVELLHCCYIPTTSHGPIKPVSQEEGEDDADEAMDAMQVDIEGLKDTSIRNKAKLRDSAQLKRIMEGIAQFEAQPNREGIVFSYSHSQV